MYYVIGDSHVSAFSGITGMVHGWPQYTNYKDIFRCIRLGPTTAFNLYKKLPLIIEILDKTNFNNQKDKIILCVGEIDCRWHIPKRHETHKKSIEDLIEDTIINLDKIIPYLENTYNTNIITYDCPGSSWLPHSETNDDTHFPRFGDQYHRNLITKKFNLTLKNWRKFCCPTKDIQHIKTDHILIDQDNNTKKEFYMDDIHLNSQKIMPFLLKELNILI